MGIPPVNVPIIGQQDAAQQAAIMQFYHGMYGSLLPVVASARLQGGIPGAADADSIALEADRITIAGMKRLGVVINKPDIDAE